MNLLTILPDDAPIYPLAPRYLHKLIIYLPKSTSKNLPLAVQLMQKAEAYCEIPIGKSVFYAAVFNIEPQALAIVNAILDLAMYWKGFNIFYNGEIVNNKSGFWTTLQCIINASKCRDYRSHCHVVQYLYHESNGIFGFFPKTTTHEYLIPCRQLPFAYSKINKKHPSSVADQLQALAVSYGCEWCPYFNISDFRPV